MKVVITGALGHIGSKLIRQLPLFFPDIEIIMVDNMLTQRYASLFNLPENASYHFIEADVSKSADFITSDCAAVIHLAAITNAEASFTMADLLKKNNFEGTRNIASACAENNVPLIFPSSTSVYGTQAELVDENCTIEELKPQSPYAETKLLEENEILRLGVNCNLKFMIFRFGTICGTSPGMRFHTAVNKFCWQAVMGKPLSVWRTALHQKRPYLCLDDAIKLIVFCIENNLFKNTVFNALTENLTVQDIIDFIKSHIPSLNIEYVDSQIMNQLSYEVSCSKITKEGFTFSGSISNDTKETINILYSSNSGVKKK